MTQNAIVTRVFDNTTAEIAVERQSACGGNCTSCGGTCTAQDIIHVIAKNSVNALTGQQVVISTHSARVIKAAFLVYILPLVLLFAGFFIAAAMSAPETLSIIAALCAFFVGILIIVLINRRYKKRPVTFEITEILQ